MLRVIGNFCNAIPLPPVRPQRGGKGGEGSRVPGRCCADRRSRNARKDGEKTAGPGQPTDRPTDRSIDRSIDRRQSRSVPRESPGARMRGNEPRAIARHLACLLIDIRAGAVSSLPRAP